MSRCFPFPPPGYQRKARNDDENLLEKEKHQEKKHKKEKKDKEKKEGKEKREKDRSDGKHREKKDKKEKHRDKDKDKKKDKEKDGDKSKDKSKASDEKRLSGQAESHVGEKLIQKEGKQKDNSADKKFFGQIGGHKAEKLSQNSSLDDESKHVKEFGKRIKDQATGTGNQFENFSGADRKKDEGMLSLVAKGASNLAAGKEKDRRLEDRTADGQSTRDGTKVGGNAMVQNTGAIAQTKFEALPRPLDKNVDRKMEGNEKTKDRESDDKRGVDRKMEGNEKTKDRESDDKRGVKSKEKDKEKKSHGKDKDRDKEKKKVDRDKRREEKQKKKEEKQKKKEEKEKKKEERAKEKIQLKDTELDKLRASNKDDIIDNHAIRTPQLPKDSHISAPNDVNLKKRKDFEANGVVHAHDILPGKVAKTTSSSHPSAQNGRILDPCLASVPASDRKEAPGNHKMDNKERKINGIIEAQPSMKHKSATPLADPVAKAPVKPPHPDSKYISQVYLVPKMEEWSDFDDQEWLFSSNGSQPKKAKVEASADEEIPSAWSEARQIGSADIIALPYVVPY